MTGRLPWPKGLPTSRRIGEATGKLARIKSGLDSLIALHESNAIILYSDKLIRQIPRSFAANAYNIFQDAMQRYQLVRLCAFWDRATEERDSLPAVIELLDDSSVISEVAANARSRWLDIGIELLGDHSREHEVPIRRAIEEQQVRDADREAKAALRALTEATDEVKSTVASPLLKSLVHVRNTYLAHNLSPKRTVESEPVKTLNNGDEERLLEITLAAGAKLQLAVNGLNIEWAERRRIAAREAKALWHGCTFSVLE